MWNPVRRPALYPDLTFGILGMWHVTKDNRRAASTAVSTPALSDSDLVLGVYETAVRNGASSSAAFEAAVAAYEERHTGESHSIAYRMVATLLAEAEIGRLRHR
jgi:hypothetical protein